MRAAVALIKFLLIPVFAMAFFGGFSKFAVMPLTDLIPANPNNSMTGILLSSVALNFILIALAASIIAFPAAYIYKKYAPLAALAMYTPAVAEAECNTVTGLKQVHHAATPLPLS
ncbi:hypothetical protein [Geopseudomonas aromaticivorans]